MDTQTDTPSLYLTHTGKFIFCPCIAFDRQLWTIMVPLHRGRSVVVHNIRVFQRPPGFSLNGKFIQKMPFLAIWLGCKPTFVKPQRWNFAWECGPRTLFPMHTNICTNFLRGYTCLWKIYTKNCQFWRIWRMWAHIFKGITATFRLRVWIGDALHQAKFCINRLRGLTP